MSASTHARARAAEARAATPGSRRPGGPRRRRRDAWTACRTLHAVRNELVAAQLDLNAVVAGRLRWSRSSSSCSRRGSRGWPPRSRAGSPSAAAAARCAGRSTIPHLATPAPDAPDAVAEKALRKRLDDAEFEEHARASHAKDLETQAALALQAAGTDDLEQLQAGAR